MKLLITSVTLLALLLHQEFALPYVLEILPKAPITNVRPRFTLPPSLLTNIKDQLIAAMIVPNTAPDRCPLHLDRSPTPFRKRRSPKRRAGSGRSAWAVAS